MRGPALLAATSLFCLAFLARSARGQEVTQSRGADQQVDYASLKSYGPWDDRNYELTAADLELLAPNERELMDPIPAFFRVLLRKEMPTLPREGPAQYPRSALQIFLQQYGGYLVDGKLYPRVEFVGGRYVVIEKNGVDYDEFKPPGGK